MNSKITKYVNKFHKIVFGTEAGNRTITFTKNISMSFSGGMIAFGVLFISNIIAARVLGPEEYGKYAIIFSVAQILALFFVLELDVSALYFLTHKAKKVREITASINTMFLINIFVFGVLSVSIYYALDPSDITENAFLLSMIMAVFFALKRMIDAYLRAEGKFTKQAIFKIAESITVITALMIFFIVLNNKEYISYAVSVILGGVVFAVLGGVVVRKRLNITGANTHTMNRIFSYNIFGLIGATVNIIVKNIDKLIVASFLGVATSGLYAVYFTASVIIGARLTQLFVNVFFPAVRENSENKRGVFDKINTLVKKIFIPLFILSSLGVFIIIILYGSQYKLVWYWVLLGGMYIAVHFCASLYGWFLSSFSKKGYKQHNMSFVYGLIIYCAIIGLAFMFNVFGITVLLIALVLYRLTGGFVSYISIKKYLQN